MGKTFYIHSSYPARGANGPMETPPSDNGPQRGLTKTVSNPGDPNFERDISTRQGFYHATKQKAVQIHPAHKGRAMRGQPGSASDMLDQATGADHGILIGLDSAN